MPADPEIILEDLQKIFDSIFLDSPPLTGETTAKDVPEWDSLTHISLLVAIEQCFKIRFRIGEVEAAKNIADLVAIIGSHLA
jgi:acyl carrier protein